jgi:hypothetical protein
MWRVEHQAMNLSGRRKNVINISFVVGREGEEKIENPSGKS